MVNVEDVVVGGLYLYKSGNLEYRVKVLWIGNFEIKAEWTELKDANGYESNKFHPNLGHTKLNWGFFPITRLILNKDLKEYL